MIQALTTALPVFIVLALGVLLNRCKIVTREGIAAMKHVAVNITLPAVLLAAFAGADYSGDSMIIPPVIFFICLLALGLGFLACRLFHLPGRLTPFLSTGFEAGMLGYSLFALLYPGQSNSSFALIDLGQVFFVFTVYKALLAGKGGLKGIVLEAIKSPTLWAIVIGLLLGATGLYNRLAPSGVSGIFDAITGFVAAPTSVLILLSIGYDLNLGQIDLRRTGAIVAMRVGVMALMLGLALLANRLLFHGVMHEGALILMFILPPPYVLPVFADAAEERGTVASALSLLTLLTLILFAVLSAIQL